MKLEIQPITQREACAYIALHHRHHKPPVGARICIALNNGEKVVGVLTAGRPVARAYDDGWTLEITRCCTDGTRNACSKLYAAARRAGLALGYRRIITYTLPEEGGASLRGAGWRVIGLRGGGSWSWPGRPRVDTHPLGQKQL